MGWTFRAASEFMRCAPDWDALCAAGGDVPFLGSAFMMPLLNEFGTGHELLAIHESARKIDVMALVVSNGRGTWRTFQPSQLPLGAWVMCSSTSPGQLLETLLRSLPGFALNFGITQVDPHLLARPGDDATLRTLDYVQTAWIEIEGSFEGYWQSRGKNLRQNTAKQRRKLEADGIVPALDVLTKPVEIADGLRDYGALESAGWKAGEGTAIHPENAQGRFYLAMLQEFCTRGRGRIYRYRFGNKVVAVDLCVENEDTQVVLKTTYDESYRTLSPAFLMRQDELKGLWAEGRIRHVEFYGKLMDWHTRWTDNARTLYHLNCYRWGFLPQLHAWVAERRQVTAT
jgi:CelD/BcsL family acetyltransferase involved in cellulose biosynthesis